MDPGEVHYATDGKKFTIIVVLAMNSQSIDIAVITYHEETDEVGVEFPPGLPGQEVQAYLEDECSKEVFAEQLAESRVQTVERLAKNAMGKGEILLAHLEEHLPLLK